VYPALFCIYPTYERLRHVRALQYSNGVRPLPLWVAYLLFDFAFVLIISVSVTLSTLNQMPYWYAVGYLFPVLILYGLAALLMGYIISMLAGSQLAAFGFTAGTMAVMFALTSMSFSVSDSGSCVSGSC
jgi:ATP-binding cassette subfamily A (ABC1) protein 3